MKKSLVAAIALWSVLAVPGCVEDLSLVGETFLTGAPGSGRDARVADGEVGPPFEAGPADALGAGTDAVVECGPGNFCADGGCCVFGVCRRNGEACGEQPQLGIVPGVCTNGSCVDGANHCGSLGEACCVPRAICTAPGAICGLSTATCAVCGDEGQECCAYGGACKSAHNTCVGLDGGQRPLCVACGLPGQICCGGGTTARKTCDSGVCSHIPGTPGLGDYCPG
jgi:hypothetical protein